MKSIARKDFIAVGSIDKTHGTKGELRITLTSDKPINEWAFLEIQGKPVPFKVESFSPTFEDGAIIKLRGIDKMEQAEPFVGYIILLPKGKRRKGEVYTEDDFTGFSLVDEKLGEIGVVESIEEFPNQLLIKTTYNGNEVLIPAVEAFIAEINEETRTILLNLPDGLI